MSKANRRRQRPGSQPSTARPTGDATLRPSGPDMPPPDSTGAAGAAGVGADATSTPGTIRTPGTARPAGTTSSTTLGAGTPRSPGTTSRPTAPRHGRRERSRATYKPSFMERYRTRIVVIAALAGVALLSAFVFLSASQPAYACSTTWTPRPTASPSAGATPNLGYVQPDMGRDHPAPGSKVTYTYCAPASGSHVNKPGVAGPITARVYSPSDNVIPQGWIHNLEHGALVVLYTGTSTGATPAGQTQLKAFYDSFPASPRCGFAKGLLGPVVARFDQMSTPFEAIVWGRVLPLDTFDEAQITAFWNQWGERTNPEDQCPSVPRSPTVSASPDASAAPSPS